MKGMRKITDPKIQIKFDKRLLSSPMPKFNEEDLFNIYLYIKAKLWYKHHKCPSKKIKCQNLEKLFLNLYERIKKKKDKSEKEKKNKTEMPFYHIRLPRQSDGNLFRRLRSISTRYANPHWTQNKI